MSVFSFKKSHTRGFALLLSIILASVVMAIGIAILRISVSQLELSATARESEMAIQGALSMTECLMYWRYENLTAFIDPDKAFYKTIECMGVTPFYVKENPDIITSDAGDVIEYDYTYGWSSGALGSVEDMCSSGQLYLMVPNDTDDLTHTFVGTRVGNLNDGNKTCDAGAICTIVIAQGYNRPCEEINTSIFTVQREITTEF